VQLGIRVLPVSGYGRSPQLGEPVPGARLRGKPIDLKQLQCELAQWPYRTDAAP
jgi:hypothetical protein